jgi:hypothetical protein
MRRRAISLVLLAFFLSASVSVPYVAEAAPKKLNFNVVPISITNITADLVSGQLTAHGLIGQQPFTTPLGLSVVPGQVASLVTCPILNLELGPIHLDVLGLVVDTSSICLDITAQQGEGLLGDLLCALANLLNQGIPLVDALNTFATNGQLGLLTDGLTDVLNEVLAHITAAHAAASASCDILTLVLGPLDLTILGLNVHLDDCNNGPVTVEVLAEPGAGNLLGNLLCGLTGLLDNNSRATVELLRAVSLLISQLLQ